MDAKKIPTKSSSGGPETEHTQITNPNIDPKIANHSHTQSAETPPSSTEKWRARHSAAAINMGTSHFVPTDIWEPSTRSSPPQPRPQPPSTTWNLNIHTLPIPPDTIGLVQQSYTSLELANQVAIEYWYELFEQYAKGEADEKDREGVMREVMEQLGEGGCFHREVLGGEGGSVAVWVERLDE